MKRFCFVVLLAAGFACVSSCMQQPAAKTPAAGKVVECHYTCTMHPAVCSAEPGTCPKCGMELVEKE